MNASAETPSVTAQAPEHLEVTWERTLSIWWSYVWRCALCSLLLGAFLGLCGGCVVGIAGRPDLGGVVGALLGWLGSIVMSIVVLRIVLRKTFPEFTIRLVRR
jgi:hypothetical protein